jgi:hypothetical protein
MYFLSSVGAFQKVGLASSWSCDLQRGCFIKAGEWASRVDDRAAMSQGRRTLFLVRRNLAQPGLM